MTEAMAIQDLISHGDWAITKLGGVAGVKAVVVKNFGYGRPYVRGPLNTLDVDKLVESPHYKALLKLIELEKSL